MKINVVGTSGVGKSTLAKRLAALLSVPYIEMDTLYWRSGAFRRTGAGNRGP